ncbi:hypothetical protein HZB00_02300 [Candidatus Woesearchaeota archaeon]|nr:hypothetical protein [Candidatus Woesearchaeota archaeon]
MSQMFMLALFGGLGGLARGVVGVAKHYRREKKPKFKLWYFLVTIITASSVGVVAGMVVTEPRLAILAGYAGTDLLEGLYKIKKK